LNSFYSKASGDFEKYPLFPSGIFIDLYKMYDMLIARSMRDWDERMQAGKTMTPLGNQAADSAK